MEKWKIKKMSPENKEAEGTTEEGLWRETLVGGKGELQEREGRLGKEGLADLLC